MVDHWSRRASNRAARTSSCWQLKLSRRTKQKREEQKPAYCTSTYMRSSRRSVPPKKEMNPKNRQPKLSAEEAAQNSLPHRMLPGIVHTSRLGSTQPTINLPPTRSNQYVVRRGYTYTSGGRPMTPGLSDASGRGLSRKSKRNPPKTTVVPLRSTLHR